MFPEVLKTLRWCAPCTNAHVLAGNFGEWRRSARVVVPPASTNCTTGTVKMVYRCSIVSRYVFRRSSSLPSLYLKQTAAREHLVEHVAHVNV